MLLVISSLLNQSLFVSRRDEVDERQHALLFAFVIIIRQSINRFRKIVVCNDLASFVFVSDVTQHIIEKFTQNIMR